jgi:hypothetical protein
MLETGRGNNDIMAQNTANVFPILAADVTPRVSVPVQCEGLDLATAVLATTDANGVYGGATGSGIIGAWKVEVSNNYPSTTEKIAGQRTDALNPTGTWVDITGNFVKLPVGGTLFAPIVKGATDPTLGITSPSGTGGSAYPVDIPYFGYRHIRFTFTPSSNQGALQRCAVFFVGKST